MRNAHSINSFSQVCLICFNISEALKYFTNKFEAIVWNDLNWSLKFWYKLFEKCCCDALLRNIVELWLNDIGSVVFQQMNIDELYTVLRSKWIAKYQSIVSDKLALGRILSYRIHSSVIKHTENPYHKCNPKWLTAWYKLFSLK